MARQIRTAHLKSLLMSYLLSIHWLQQVTKLSPISVGWGSICYSEKGRKMSNGRVWIHTQYSRVKNWENKTIHESMLLNI